MSRFLASPQNLKLEPILLYASSGAKGCTCCMQGALRTRETIEKFKRVPPQPGQTSPLLVYFGTLLTRGKLNAFESVELSQLVISQNKKHLLDNWFKARQDTRLHQQY